MTDPKNSIAPNAMAVVLSLGGFWLAGGVVIALASALGLQNGYLLLLNLFLLGAMLTIVTFAGRFAGKNTHTARRWYAFGFAAAVTLPDLVRLKIEPLMPSLGVTQILMLALVFYRSCYSHLRASALGGHNGADIPGAGRPE